MLNGFENQWLLFKNILKYNTHTQIFLFYRVSYFNLNRTKYSMLQEYNANLDLTEIFGLKKSPACSPDLSPIEYIQEYKYCWSSKNFLNMLSLKRDWSLSNRLVQFYSDNYKYSIKTNDFLWKTFIEYTFISFIK